MARILIADDEPETVELVSNLCRDRGHQPFHYNSSEATIDALPNVAPQLVIADLQSEKTDGSKSYERAGRNILKPWS